MQAPPSCAVNALPVLCVADRDHASWGSQRDLYPRPLPRSCCSPPLPHRRKVAPLSCFVDEMIFKRVQVVQASSNGMCDFSGLPSKDNLSYSTLSNVHAASINLTKDNVQRITPNRLTVLSSYSATPLSPCGWSPSSEYSNRPFQAGMSPCLRGYQICTD